MTDQGAEDHRPRRVDPVYYADRSGSILLYSGDVHVLADGVLEGRRGELTLRLESGAGIDGRVSMSADSLGGRGFRNDARIVGVPAGASLQPVMGPRLDGFSEQILPASPLRAGDLREARRILVHVTGDLTSWLADVELQGGDRQSRVDFELLGWPAALVAVQRGGQKQDPAEFSHVVEIKPPADELEDDAVDERLECLFPLLSFIAGQEVGTTIAVGLDGGDRPVWTSWASPRRAIGHPGVRWCPPQLMPEALPEIARGLGDIWADDARREAIKRAIGYLGVAVRGLLEVRVPMACVGLEVLAWVVLQRESWTTANALDDMSAGAMVRLLVRASEIPVEIPAHFTALNNRLRSINRRDWAGPEIVSNVRNRLVHPPKRMDKLEWPSKDEMIEAWQLATWYLELAVLRQLGYVGSYSSRLKLGQWEGEVEPVPWSEESVSDQ